MERAEAKSNDSNGEWSQEFERTEDKSIESQNWSDSPNGIVSNGEYSQEFERTESKSNESRI